MFTYWLMWPKFFGNSNERIAMSVWGQYLKLVNRGKVRDTYALPGHPNLLLVVATDRISVFDFVLPATVPHKGEVLNAMNIFWRLLFRSQEQAIFDDLVAYGNELDRFLPESLQSNQDLWKRAVVVEKLQMLPIECIVRGYLTGSGLKSYRENRRVCGIRLPKGLGDGSKLTNPIFSPTTKAKEGHDEPLDAGEVLFQHGQSVASLSLRIYGIAASYADAKGVIIADTKLEMGRDIAGRLIIADEVLTPDSSRFWDCLEWSEAVSKTRTPKPHDKQLVRDYMKQFGIQDWNPKDVEHQREVGRIPMDEGVLADTATTYLGIFERLVGKSLSQFQIEHNMC